MDGGVPMEQVMPAEMVLGLAGVPAIVALTEATKVVFPRLEKRFHPLVALGWALALNVGLGSYAGGDPVLGAATALIAGLAAVGLYSSGKSLGSAR